MAPRDANVPSGGSSGKSKPARASWRGTAARATVPDRGAANRSWWAVRRSEPSHDAGFRAKLAVSVVLLATLVAAFVIFLRAKPSKVPMIALAATYRGSSLLPPNSWTIEDFERFEGQLANRGPGGFLSAEAGMGEVDVKVFRDDWIGGPRQGENALVQLRDLLKPVVPGGPNNDVVLIYVSGHGVVNRDGEPCLLVEDSSPLDAATWLPVKNLCERICEVKSDEHTRNVLVLDCNRIEVSGQCGLLYNSFAEQLKDLVENKLDKKLCRNLVVLNSTSPGEVAWAAPELGGSAFGYFFCQALSGAADGDDDGELSLNELSEYLRRRVDRWVVEHRSGSQRPMEPLFVEGKHDFPLAYCGAARATPTLTEAETRRLDEAYGRWHRDQDWDAVADLWILHNKLRDEKLYREDPLAWAAFERGLLRLEQLLLAGKAYERECREVPQRLRQGIDAAAQKRQQDVAVCSLPLAGQFTQALAGADGKADVNPAEPDPAELALSPRDRYCRQANKAWTGLLKKNPITPQVATQALATVKEPLGKDAADLVEMHFLRVLGRYLDKSAKMSDDLLARGVRSRQQAELAATPVDPRVQYWLASHLDKGDASRREAEDLLFVGPPAADDGNAARADFDQHEKLAWQAAEDEYLTARSLADEIAKAYDLRDRGWARAPYLALWQWNERIRPQQGSAAAARAERSQSPEQWGRLMSVVERLHVLSRDLDENLAVADQRPVAGTESGTTNVWKLKDTEKLDEDLRLLESAFDAISTRLDDEGKQQENLVKIERHLALPLVAAAQRNSLRERFLSLLHDKYEANKASPGDPQSGVTSKTVEHEETTFSHSDLLGGFSNHPFVELLKVQESTAAEKPPADDTAKPAWVEQVRQLAIQGDTVRVALGALTANVTTSLDQSRKQMALIHDRLSENPDMSGRELNLKKIAEVREGRSDADRLVRAAAALCDLANVTDPTLELRKFDLHQLMLRQCQRTLDDFWGPKDASGKTYFERVAQEYLRAAEGLCSEPDAMALRAHCVSLLARRAKAAGALLVAASTEDLSIRDQEQDLVQIPLAVRRRSEDLPRGIAATLVRYVDGEAGEVVPLTKRRPGSAGGADGTSAWIRRIGVPVANSAAGPSLGIVEQKADGASVDYWFKPVSTRAPLEAVVYYRANEVRSGIEIAPPGVRIVYEPKRPPAPTVRVRGDEKVPTSVMFIFDCSASMFERDFPRGDGTTVRRLDGARDTLVSILKQPSLRQFRGVGLRVYGHRFGQNKKGEIQLSKYANAQRQKSLAAGTPFAQRHPGADVELVFPSEFLDERRRDEMISTLGSLESWGFTPLYLAISDAVNDPRPKDERRRIIAITDGFNEQGGVGIESQVTAKALEDLLAAHSKVTLDIIGFGNEFSRDARAKAQDLADMKRIAARQGGGFYQAATAGDLLKRILKSLSLGKFEVVPAGGSPTDAETFELENETWRGEEPSRSAAGFQRRARKYDVRVVEIDSPQRPSMPIELEGGEALELFLERAGNTPQLAYRYYDPERRLDLRSRDVAAVDERLNSLGRVLPPAGAGIRDRGKYWVASLTPAWQSQERLAKFFISVQNHTLTKFSPRPAEAWIEITPINDDGEAGGAVYRFCDLDFAPGRPVPVLECEAQRFPHDTCKRARAQIWFSMEPTRGDAVVTTTVADLKRREEIVDGVRISADVAKESDGSVAVRVREQRMENETARFQPGRVMIQMSPLAVRVEHDYSARRHTFYFEPDAEVADYTVRLTSVEKFKKNAISGTLPETEVGR